MTTEQFIGVFLGLCTTLFGVLSTMKAAQEIREKNFSEAVEDLRRCGYATIFTFVCMLGAIINLSEFCDTVQRKANSALRKKSSELSELRGQLDPNQDRWVAVGEHK